MYTIDRDQRKVNRLRKMKTGVRSNCHESNSRHGYCVIFFFGIFDFFSVDKGYALIDLSKQAFLILSPCAACSVPVMTYS